MTIPSTLKWTPPRPDVLVVTCSDGRLQEATDAFLADEFKIRQYDRFYVPGGGGALASSGTDPVRASRMRGECRYLIDLHHVHKVIVLFHGPAEGGKIEMACADYRRKLPWLSVAELRHTQERDAAELLEVRREWAGEAEVLIYRCEVDPNGSIMFFNLAPAAAAAAAK